MNTSSETDQDSRKPNHYVTKVEMLEELREYRRSGIISERLGWMFMELARRHSTKGNFLSYTYRDDMISEAVFRMVSQIDKFNPDHPKANPFWYFSVTAKRQFLNFIKAEKKFSSMKILATGRYLDEINDIIQIGDSRKRFADDDVDDQEFQMHLVEGNAIHQEPARQKKKGTDDELGEKESSEDDIEIPEMQD